MLFFLYYSIVTLIVNEEITIRSRYTLVQNKTNLAHKNKEIISALYRIQEHSNYKSFKLKEKTIFLKKLTCFTL
jgi:hypothetical protein